MTVSTPRTGLAADALAATAVAGLGLLLLWCGSRMLPAATAGSAAFSRDVLSPAPPSLTLLTQITGFCAAAAGVLLTLWWVAGFFVALTGCLLHRLGFRAAGRRTLSLAPRPLRRLAAAALGLSLAAGSAVGAGGAMGAAPASAASTSAAAASAAANTTPRTAHPAVPGTGSAAPAPEEQGNADGAATPATADPAEAVSPLWRPAPPQPAAGNLLTGSPRPDEREVVVAAGDTLWSLAAAQLGPYATDAETAAFWPRWYELNREVIGPDPGLIHPGQVLAMPPR